MKHLLLLLWACCATHALVIHFTVVPTCDKPERFVRVMAAFLENCLDCNNVTVARWIAIEDECSESEVAIMQGAYPWMEWVHKGGLQKGEDYSMNLLQNMTRDADYVLHMQDSWELLGPPNAYLFRMVQILEGDPELGQVLFNENYREDPDGHPSGARVVGSELSDNGEYLIHVYDPKQTLAQPGELSNGHWPHYSFRPGVLRRSVWTKVGSFAMRHRHLERDYAARYMRAGYKTAFLRGVPMRRLTKKSWERDMELASSEANKDLVQTFSGEELELK